MHALHRVLTLFVMSTSDSVEPSLAQKKNNNKRVRLDSSSLPADFDKDVQCPVCKEIPSGAVSQCQNLHLFCEPCLDVILKLPKASCPACRLDFKKFAPKRNLLAETVINALTIQCPHQNCAEMVSAKRLASHRDEECPFRPVDCRFKPLGCQAHDIPFNEVDKHEREQCQTRVDDAALVLFTAVFDEKTWKLKKLQEELEKMTDSYNTINQECLQAQEKYNNAEDSFTLHRNIVTNYLKEDNIKDMFCQNVYFCHGLSIPAANTARKVAYANSRFKAFGCNWLARLILVLQDAADILSPPKAPVALYISLAAISKHPTQLESISLAVIELCNGHPLQLHFTSLFCIEPDDRCINPHPGNNIGVLSGKLPKYDIEAGTVPWGDEEKKLGRFWTISEKWNQKDKESAMSLWQSHDLIPAIRLVLVNNSESMQASSKFSCKKSKLFSADFAS